jgi:protein-S-isoprenylcysteine O-methyltransferase Ste14
MPASDFEFRNRTWLIFGIFFVALAFYWIDPRNSGQALAESLHVRIGFLARRDPETIVRILFAIGSLVVAIGALIRAWGGAYLRAVVVHDSKVRSEKLVADGPFRYTRNPIYFGSLIAVFGSGLLFSLTGWIVQMIVALVFCYRLISREEKELAAEQGERFLAYRRAVPRLFPSIRPRLPASGATPHWPESLRGQTSWWGVAAAEIAYACSLRLGFAILVALAGFVVFIVQKYVMKSFSRPVTVHSPK